MKQTNSNHLENETSPYLLQHAHNPVDWYPWGEAAFSLARAENKPILLSIGYSACHWCHVMAHESFEDQATAALMNRLFVNIKVDREERPDVDKIYQSAYQLMFKRGGGWPLTLFLTPDDHTPFFGGTYFPPTPRHGLPAFSDLLQRVADFFHTQTASLRQQKQAVHHQLEAYRLMMQQKLSEDTRQVCNVEPLNMARERLQEYFDSVQGGFGGAPKFPHLPSIERLFRHYARVRNQGEDDPQALHIALFSLEKMACGGLYDQMGGGFYRYAVDDLWQIPHFEKMLYDNGPFIEIYTHAWQITAQPLFKRVAEETANWALEVMQAPEGGFYASLDADSAGHEGQFYVWTRQEVRDLLDADQYARFAQHFGLHSTPNFEGKWHFVIDTTLEELAERFGDDLAHLTHTIENARRRLLDARQQRVPPGRDEKILCAWNALMIKGLAQAGDILGHPEYLVSAERAVDFIRSQMWDGRQLYAVYKDGQARFPAYLDDYAFLLDALLALLQARWRRADLDFAVTLAEALLTRFEDAEHGGFFFTSHDHEALLQRPKTFADESLPAGNGVAAHALGRLGHLLGEPRYLAALERCLQAAWPHLVRFADTHNTMLMALEESLFPPQIVTLRGELDKSKAWKSNITSNYVPWRITWAIPNKETDLPNLLAHQATSLDNVIVYICDGHECRAPISEYTTLKEQLGLN